jgi:ribosomal protein S18 acetylase RimI-like enzyme
MDRPETVLRAARPTHEEGLAYGRYLDELAPGFRHTLGRGAIEVLASAYIEPGHDLSFEHVTFAERGEEIVGVIAGYTAEEHRYSSDEAVRRAAGGGVLQRMRAALLCSWLRFFGTRSDDEYYVWALAVSEDLRGQGIGSILMDFTEDRARALGCAKLTLDADARNEGARRFYEHRGMTVESEWPRVPLVPRAIVRMAKPL